jgi:hypothetical protein
MTGDTSFSPSVLQVFCLRSEEQVGWIDAQAIVAPMTYASAVCAISFGDRAEVQLVADAMCGSFEMSADRHDAVAWVAGGERPVPALIRPAFVDAHPEALGEELDSDGFPAPDAAALRRAEL